MKILIVGGMFPPMRTGTSFYTKNIAKTLQRQGHDIQVVTLGDQDSEGCDGLIVHRLKSFRLPLKGFFKHYSLCSLSPGNWLQLHRIVRDFDADAILLVNHYLDIAIPTIFAGLLNKVNISCSVGTQLQSQNPRRDKILNILDRMICGNLVFPFCKQVIAWDSQILKYLQDVHGNKVTDKAVIVNYGVASDDLVAASADKDYRFAGSIIGVGAVSEQRSFVPLVKAFKSLTAKYPELKLRIIGHVYYDEAVRTARQLGIADKVEFMGEVPHEQVVKLMQEADVFYSSLTGKYTAMGTATIEAMLIGTPAVVNTPSDLLGNIEIIDKQHLIQSPDFIPENIASRIDSLLQNEHLRKSVGQAGKDFVLQNLNWGKVGKDMAVALNIIARKRK